MVPIPSGRASLACHPAQMVFCFMALGFVKRLSQPAARPHTEVITHFFCHSQQISPQNYPFPERIPILPEAYEKQDYIHTLAG